MRAGTNQASAVAAATGGSLLNNFLSFSGTDFVNAINDAIGSATTTLDLVFGSSYAARASRSRSRAPTRSAARAWAAVSPAPST